jgi:hypothetical protein
VDYRAIESMSGKDKIQENVAGTTLRKVQAYHGERSLTIVLPRIFAVDLGITKGDYLKVKMENKKLILEKADV